jgi:hypothetical protein
VFVRLRWLLFGIGIGSSGSWWLKRKVSKRIERYTPERVSIDLAAAVRGLGQDLRAAAAEGRAATRAREAELRAQLAQS